MATSLTAATLTVTLTEDIKLNGTNQGATNVLSIESFKCFQVLIVGVADSVNNALSSESIICFQVLVVGVAVSENTVLSVGY